MVPIGTLAGADRAYPQPLTGTAHSGKKSPKGKSTDRECPFVFTRTGTVAALPHRKFRQLLRVCLQWLASRAILNTCGVVCAVHPLSARTVRTPVWIVLYWSMKTNFCRCPETRTLLWTGHSPRQREMSSRISHHTSRLSGKGVGNSCQETSAHRHPASPAAAAPRSIGRCFAHLPRARSTAAAAKCRG